MESEILFDEDKIDLKDEKIDIINIFYTNTLLKSMYIEFMFFLENNIKVKKCKNCERFFIPLQINSEYCNNVFDETGKTCSEVGRFIVEKKKLEENEFLKIYKRIYAKLNMRQRRNSLKYPKESFDKWVEETEKLLEDIENKDITLEEFEKIIDR